MVEVINVAGYYGVFDVETGRKFGETRNQQVAEHQRDVINRYRQIQPDVSQGILMLEIEHLEEADKAEGSRDLVHPASPIE